MSCYTLQMMGICDLHIGRELQTLETGSSIADIWINFQGFESSRDISWQSHGHCSLSPPVNQLFMKRGGGNPPNTTYCEMLKVRVPSGCTFVLSGCRVAASLFSQGAQWLHLCSLRVPSGCTFVLSGCRVAAPLFSQGAEWLHLCSLRGPSGCTFVLWGCRVTAPLFSQGAEWLHLCSLGVQSAWLPYFPFPRRRVATSFYLTTPNDKNIFSSRIRVRCTFVLLITARWTHEGKSQNNSVVDKWREKTRTAWWTHKGKRLEQRGGHLKGKG